MQRFFERVATDSDTMRLTYYDERVIEQMAEISGVGEESEVADVSTGTGFIAAGIAPRVKRIVGLLRRGRAVRRLQLRAARHAVMHPLHDLG